MSAAPLLSGDSIPYLPRHVIFRHDPVRGRYVILAPERVLVPDETAVALLQQTDGKRSLAEIAAHLATLYDAPADLILKDAIELYHDLVARGFLRLRAGAPGDV